MNKPSTPTIRQIAAATGYSKSTVSAALRNNPQIATTTRDAIQKAAEKMGYRRDDRIAELMGYLSEHKRKAASSPIIWLNDENECDAWRDNPWYREILNGARSRATELGYQLDDLWCRAPGMNRKRIASILRSRGIRGAVLTRPYQDSILTDLDLDFCACAQVQCDPWNQTYHVAVPAYYYNINIALDQLKHLGYTRPGLAEMEGIENDTKGAHRAGYLAQAEAGKIAQPLPILKYHWEDEDTLERLSHWITNVHPDVVICQDTRFREFLAECNLRVPEDISLVHLNLAEDVAGWSGIDPNHKALGAATIDLVVNQIHRNETGCTHKPYSLHIKGQWVDGSTTRRLAKG